MNWKEIKTLALWGTVLIGFIFIAAHPGWPEDTTPSRSSHRVAPSYGEGRTVVSVRVGSTTPVSPFASLSTGGGDPSVSTGAAPGFLSNAVGAQLDELRRISLTNETSYYVHLGTWSRFVPDQSFWTISRSSIGANAVGQLQTFETFNRATFWMLLESTGSVINADSKGVQPSTQTFKVNFEKQ